MKYTRALELIKKGTEFKKEQRRKTTGFMVHFEVRGGGVLSGDYFPDKREGEKLIPTEEAAWRLAELFAFSMKNQNVVNVYVVGSDWRPVPGYSAKKLNYYP